METKYNKDEIENMTEEEWYYNVYCEENPLIGHIKYLSKEELISIYGSFLTKEQSEKLREWKQINKK